MLWLKAFHIIAMVAWFAGLFYLPRLFVYHAETTDPLSQSRFNRMQRRLYYGIMTPAAFFTLSLGLALLIPLWDQYQHMKWLHLKLGLVSLLLLFHVYCGICHHTFVAQLNRHSARFYRMLNEIPTLLLAGIVILVVVKPF